MAAAVAIVGAMTNVAFAFDWQSSDGWESVTVEEVKAWIATGADLAQIDEQGWTPLHWAARTVKDPAIIQALVKAGANINARTDLTRGQPLHSAARANTNPAIISALIEAGADINARTSAGGTPLHAAATHYLDSFAMIPALVAHGADLNSKNDAGLTALDLALRLRRVNIAGYLSNPTQVKREAEEYLRNLKE